MSPRYVVQGAGRADDFDDMELCSKGVSSTCA